MRKITFTFGKKRSYERYYEQYMNLIGMDNLEKSRSLIIEKIKRTAAKADGNQSQREKERTIIETMKADIKGIENSLNRGSDIAILIATIALIYSVLSIFDIKITDISASMILVFVSILTVIVTFGLGGLIIFRQRKADERGFLLSILEDYEYDDPNEKENVKTVNLNIVCKVKRK